MLEKHLRRKSLDLVAAAVKNTIEAKNTNPPGKYGRHRRPMNAFGRWCLANGWSGEALDRELGVGRQSGYRYTLPLDHPRFMVPRPPVMARIVAMTAGAITPNDFYAVGGQQAGQEAA
jgi:hypothetical protein